VCISNEPRRLQICDWPLGVGKGSPSVGLINGELLGRRTSGVGQKATVDGSPTSSTMYASRCAYGQRCLSVKRSNARLRTPHASQSIAF
jgi:hypothetical protein